MAALALRSLTNYHPAAHSRLAMLATTFRRWRNITRERRVLAGLNDYELKDFGATRGDVERELARPFWRSPQI